MTLAIMHISLLEPLHRSRNMETELQTVTKQKMFHRYQPVDYISPTKEEKEETSNPFSDILPEPLPEYPAAIISTIAQPTLQITENEPLSNSTLTVASTLDFKTTAAAGESEFDPDEEDYFWHG